MILTFHDSVAPSTTCGDRDVTYLKSYFVAFTTSAWSSFNPSQAEKRESLRHNLIKKSEASVWRLFSVCNADGQFQFFPPCLGWFSIKLASVFSSNGNIAYRATSTTTMNGDIFARPPTLSLSFFFTLLISNGFLTFTALFAKRQKLHLPKSLRRRKLYSTMQEEKLADDSRTTRDVEAFTAAGSSQLELRKWSSGRRLTNMKLHFFGGERVDLSRDSVSRPSNHIKAENFSRQIFRFSAFSLSATKIGEIIDLELRCRGKFRWEKEEKTHSRRGNFCKKKMNRSARAEGMSVCRLEQKRDFLHKQKQIENRISSSYKYISLQKDISSISEKKEKWSIQTLYLSLIAFRMRRRVVSKHFLALYVYF